MNAFSLFGLLGALWSLFDPVWRHSLPAIAVLLGLALCWRGLLGGPEGARGLLRRRARALGRIEGFRLLVVGLAVVGLGAAWFWDTALLLLLALGIGGVEVLESSVIIAAMRRDGGRVTGNRVRMRPAGADARAAD